MKSKPSKPKSPGQANLDLTPGSQMDVNQVLTFETVEFLLAYDREELIEVPEKIGRALKSGFPQQFVKLKQPKTGS